MKVAFATENLIDVDAHFGWAKKIAIYEVQPESSRLLEVVEFAGDLAEDGTEDKLIPKLEAVRDCAMLYVAAIGGSAAAKVVNLRVHPVKVPTPQSIASIIERDIWSCFGNSGAITTSARARSSSASLRVRIENPW